MATIVYLDADDEITSAAARIRGAPETKVALVLPAGSRLATSRINFRLLAREALERNRVLSIVAADPAARAIAASAGLPVHPTVGDFEASLGPGPADVAAPGAQAEPTDLDASGAPPRRTRRRSGPAAAPPTARDASAAAPSEPAIGSGRPGEQLSADLLPAGEKGPSVGSTAGASWAPQPRRPSGAAPPVRPPVLAPPDRSTPPVPPPTETRARSGAATIPVIAGPRTRRGVPGGLIATLGAIAVVLVILAALGYLLLPSATVVVTPVAVPVGPVQFVVRADPDATSIDTTAGVIPAQRLTKDFTASGDFPATGKRIAQTKAKGNVTFRNCDTGGPHTIPAGSVVLTDRGVQFATAADVRLPRAIANPPTLTCNSGTVSVTAIKPGTTGNVPAGAIDQIPPGYDPKVVDVTNANPTSGGARQEFVRVQQSDIDNALAGLTKQIGAAFATWTAAPPGLPAGATAYPPTGTLGAAIPTVDPTTLLAKEVASFTLGATASGTVVTVDPKLVDQVAAERIKGQVPAGHTLQDGSAKATHDSGQTVGEIVDFRVTATAAAIPVLDPVALRDRIKGKSVDEARRLLEEYGTVTIETWPGFVGSIPTIDARLELTIAGPPGTGGASPTPGTSAP